MTERGETQARRGAIAAIDHGPFDAVVTSTLTRAQRTGCVIADALDIPLLEPLTDLAERAVGEWEGWTRAEIDERFPGFLEAGRRPDGYEPDESIVERSGRALRLLAVEHPATTLLVVAHGGIVHALERAHDGATPWQRLDNLAGRWFAVIDDAVVPVGERIALVPDGGPAIPPPEPGYA